MTEQDFLAWESKSKDTIDFKTIYVDIAGDIVAGLYLSQCVFWHLPNKQGDTKLRIERDGKLWIARADSEWWPEIRLTTKQARRARELLVEKKIMQSEIFKFNGTPKCHVRVIMPALMAAINQIILDEIDLPSEANGLASQGETTRPVGRPSLTENTTEITAESTKPNSLSLVPNTFEQKTTKTKKKPKGVENQEINHILNIMRQHDKGFNRTQEIIKLIKSSIKDNGFEETEKAVLGRLMVKRNKDKSWRWLFIGNSDYIDALGAYEKENAAESDMQKRWTINTDAPADFSDLEKKLNNI